MTLQGPSITRAVAARILRSANALFSVNISGHGDPACRTSAEIPRANISELAIRVQHRLVRPNIGHDAAERSKPAVPLNDLALLEILQRLVEEVLRFRQVLVRVAILDHPEGSARETDN